MKRRGLSPEQMLEEYPLTLAQLHAALSYAYENLAEIEAAFQEDQKLAEHAARAQQEFFSKRSAGE